jgi:hypothetical protein
MWGTRDWLLCLVKLWIAGSCVGVLSICTWKTTGSNLYWMASALNDSSDCCKSPHVDASMTLRNISPPHPPFLFQIHVLLSSCDANMWRRDNCCLPGATILVSIYFSQYIGMNLIKLLWRQAVYKLVLSGSVIYHATHMTGDDLWQLW